MDWGTKNELGMMTVPIITFVTLVLYYCYFFEGRDHSSETEIQESSVVSCCKNPNCVRCQRYRYVQERARRKLSWILRDLEARDPSTFSKLNARIPDAILRSGTYRKNYDSIARYGKNNQPSALQNPTVLMVFDLPSKEIVTDWHQNACNYLKQRQTRTIVREALFCLGDSNISDVENDRPSTGDSKWTVNDSSPEGDWRVFQILNQGVWNPVLLSNNKEPCRKLLELVRNIPGLLDNSLFGNAFVSKIYPGTIIEPHCGPTNIRHRLQFLLKLPDTYDVHQKPRLSLSVGHEDDIIWDMNNDTFVFDDSFVHSVTYPNEEPRKDGRTTASIENSKEQKHPKKDSLARLVLIVDLWYPELQEVEMKLLRDLYPPYTSSTIQ